MYKLILSIGLLLTATSKSIYEISLPMADGSQLSLSTFKGKKLVIVTGSVASLRDSGQVLIRAVQKNHPETGILVVPATDFDASVKPAALKILADSGSKSNLAISSLVAVKKGAAQNPLMSWLTDPAQNNHFSADVDTDFQVYLVNETGQLYAVLQKGTPWEVFSALLEQTVFEKE